MSRCARRATTPRVVERCRDARERRIRARASNARAVELLRWEDASSPTHFERAFPTGGRHRTELWTRAEASATGGEPVVGIMSPSCAALLELSREEANEATFAALAGGESAWRGGETRAHAYAGHQFGKWAGLLGDGRAITIGTVIESEELGAFEVQLKGAGKTAYSRYGDGRASLASALREFLASEAMACLRVRTTRALCVTATNDGVVRQTASNKTMLLPGGVLTRVFERCGALRFGTFEWPASRGDDETTRALADYVIACGSWMDGELESMGDDDAYGSFLCAVARRSGELVARWQSIGFVHGVMNTDNASILGLSLDYGPFGFMEAFDENYSPNVDDDTGMYVYSSQPSRMRWNVERLCDAFARIAPKSARRRALEAFDDALTKTLYAEYSKKFGVEIRDSRTYDEIVGRFHRVLARGRFDFTTSHRALGPFASCVVARGESATASTLAFEMFAHVRREEGVEEAFESDAALASAVSDFGRAYADALLRRPDVDPHERRLTQDASNPAIVPRAHVLDTVVRAACERDDWEPAREFLAALSSPYRDLA